MHKQAIYGLSVAILLIILMPVIGITAYSPQDYTQSDSNVNKSETKFLRPSEIVELYPMSEDEIKAIVHIAPQCPVIVDGVLYEGKEIYLFDGQRLHFTTGKRGNLYAFTDAVKMEAFLEKEYGNIFDQVYSTKEVSILYMDWMYGGLWLVCSPGQQLLNLENEGFNNCISSAEISTDAPVTMWDYAGLTGDSFTMPPGSNYAVLALQGWNDRASSIS
ncbi:MAG: hypothetical protein PHF74_06660 [Dehalococcoidales bacterium]|nr:hypothetical protein [Dehalococcoidales bacterium]